jgi:glycine dehydrogenase subunit 1
MREVATRCAQGARYTFDQLVGIDGVAPISTQPFFREFALRTPQEASTVLERLAGEGFLGGLALSALGGPDGSVIANDWEHTLIIAVTERRTKFEIDEFATAFAKAVK